MIDSSLSLCVAVRAAVERVDEALDCSDPLALMCALQNPNLALRGLVRDHAGWYLEQMSADREQKALVRLAPSSLTHKRSVHR